MRKPALPDEAESGFWTLDRQALRHPDGHDENAPPSKSLKSPVAGPLGSFPASKYV